MAEWKCAKCGFIYQAYTTTCPKCKYTIAILWNCTELTNKELDKFIGKKNV